MIVNHPIKPFFDKTSKILILGSFPSVKSREQNFFYGHKQNRFWRLISTIYNYNVPKSIDEKKILLKEILSSLSATLLLILSKSI